MSNTPLNADDKIHPDSITPPHRGDTEKWLIIGSLVRDKRINPGKAFEILETYAASDRKKHELEARVDELSKLGGFLFVGDIHVRGRHQRSYDDRIAELKQELEKL